MNAEKTAVLVVTGIVAVLLAATLARSRPDDEPLKSTDDRRRSAHQKERPLADPFVRIRGSGLPGGGSPAPDPRPGPIERQPGSSRSYSIKADDTFESIAFEVYGRRSLAHLLKRANPTVNPRRLKIGSEIIVPPGQEQVQQGRGQRRARPRSASEGWHVVRSGERLETIARAHYGRGSDWKRIYDANRDQLRNPDRIREGMRLRIP